MVVQGLYLSSGVCILLLARAALLVKEVLVHKCSSTFSTESTKQFPCYADPVFGANYSINPTGIILWIVHAVGIISMAAF